MVYSELPTLSLLQFWGRQEFLTSRVGISPHMIQETLSLLSSLAVQREIVSVSGLPGLITLITLPVKVDHREKRERREWVRGGRSVNRSAVSECGPGAGSCDLAAVIWVTHGLSLGSLSLSLDFPVATHRRRRGEVSAWVTHVATAGICHESENWSGP